MKFYADKHRSERHFEEGEYGFLKLQAFKQNSMKIAKDSKFSPRYFGPYKILKRIGSVVYRLELSPSARIHNTFHVSLLKKKLGSTDLAQIDPPLEAEALETLYTFKILDRKVYKRHNAVAISALVQ